MKVIGETEEGVLLTASKNEIANLFGAYSSHQMDEIGMKTSDIKPGLEINVKGAYEKMYWLEHRGYEFNELRVRLREALNRLENDVPLFKRIVDVEPNL